MRRLACSFVGLVLLPSFAVPQDVAKSKEPELAVQKLDVKAGMHAPSVIDHPEVEFPEQARQRGIGGKCSIALVVDTSGRPRDVRVVRSSDPAFAPTCLRSMSETKFKPATAADGTPVAVEIHTVLAFHREGSVWPIDPIRYAFGSPSGVLSTSPDTKGVYPLTKVVSRPELGKFVDKGYGDLGFQAEGKSPCEVLLTVSSNGKPSDAKVIKCEREELEEPVVLSLMASKYKPGSVNGKPVAVRAKIHVEYGDFARLN